MAIGSHQAEDGGALSWYGWPSVPTRLEDGGAVSWYGWPSVPTRLEDGGAVSWYGWPSVPTRLKMAVLYHGMDGHRFPPG